MIFFHQKILKLPILVRFILIKDQEALPGIRNSMSVVKAFNVAKNIDYYCYNLDDFKDEKDLSYENIPNLCKKYKIKKNLINPVYLS
jgi:hypothetical protein